MRTITEITGMSLKAVRDQLPALRKEATETATAAAGADDSRRDEVKAELTKRFTESATAAVTERLRAKYTESATAEGKADDELTAAVQAGIDADLASETEKEVATHVEGALDAEMKKANASASSAQIDAALEAKIGETRKLEGEKLSLFMTALQMTEGKKGNLKRVVVGALNEGEKAPSGAIEKDGKFFVIEFFSEHAQRQAPVEDRDARGGRDGKRGGGRDGKGRGGPGGGAGGGRGPGGPGGFGGGGGAGRGGRPGAPSTESGSADGRSNAGRPSSGIVMVNVGVKAPPGLVTPTPARAPRPPREPREPKEARAPRPPREPKVETPPNGVVIGPGGKLSMKSDMPSLVVTGATSSSGTNAEVAANPTATE